MNEDNILLISEDIKPPTGKVLYRDLILSYLSVCQMNDLVYETEDDSYWRNRFCWSSKNKREKYNVMFSVRCQRVQECVLGLGQIELNIIIKRRIQPGATKL